MAEGIDTLLKNIKSWFQERPGTGIATADVVRKGFSEGGALSGKMDPKVQAEYLKIAIQQELKLIKLITEEGMSYKEATDELKKEVEQLEIKDKLSREQKARSLDVIRMFKDQNKIQRQNTLLQRVSMKSATKSMKYPAGSLKGGVGGKLAVSPGGAKGGAGIAKGGGAAGFALAAVVVAAQVAKAIGMTFIEELGTAMRGGWHGVLQATVNVFQKLASVISESLGKVVGTIGGILVQGYMILVKRVILETQAQHKFAARTGQGGYYDKKGAFQGALAPEVDLNMFGGSTQLMNEWAGAMGEVGIRGKQTLEDFYRIGQTMGLTGQETAKYFESMLSSAQDSNIAMKNMRVMFQDVSVMSTKAGISTNKLATWVSDAAVQARMLNVDFKSVSNTMKMLVNNQKTLAAFGVDLRSQGPQILKTLTGVATSWDMATHAMVGMGLYAEKYKKDTGKEMGVGRGYIASRYGFEVAKGFTMEKGLWNVPEGLRGAAALQRTPKMTADQLKYMQQFAVSQTEGIKDEGERMIAQKKILSDIFKIEDEGAQTAIMTAKEGQLKELASSAELQKATMSVRDINLRMLDMGTRSENIQLRIYEIAKNLLSVITHGIMGVMSVLQLIIGTTPAMMAALTTQGELPFKWVTEGAKGVITHFPKAFESAKEAVNLTEKVLKDVAVPFTKEITRKKHSGGPFNALQPYIAKFNERLALKNDEFVFAAGGPGFISPGGPGEFGHSRNSVQLIFNIENGSPEMILDKVRNALSYANQMG